MLLSQMSDTEILDLAKPIMDNLIEGSTEEDWSKHTRDFTDRIKASLSEEELLKQCKFYKSKFGNFDKRSPVGITRHPDYVNTIWKQEMTESSGEFMAILTLVERKGKIKVARCWVDLWEINSEN